MALFGNKGLFRAVSTSACGRAAISVRCLATGGKAQARLFFSVPKKVAFGYSVGLVGSAESVGSWNPEQGLTLTWHENDCWSGEVEVPAGEQIEYKFFTRNAAGSVEEWQPGNNLLLDVPDAANAVILVTDDWNGKDRILSMQADPEPAAVPEKPSVPESLHKSEPQTTSQPDELSINKEPDSLDLEFQPPESSSIEEATSLASAALSTTDLNGGEAKADLPVTADRAQPTSVSAAEELEIPSEEELKTLTVKELKGLLKERGLVQTGRKPELIERLREGWKTILQGI